MSDISIEKEIVMKRLDEITPYEKNPRKNDKTVELLCKIIPQVGFNVPLVIDSAGVIVKGHARYRAAQQLGLESIPCIVTHADPEAIRADRIADNKISEFSEWVNEELMHEVDMLDLDFDFADFGLPRQTYEDIPSIDDFVDEELDEEQQQSMSDEDKQRIYAEFLERQAKEGASQVQMTTQSSIDAAQRRQADVPKKPRNYKQCTCEKCGNILYVDMDILYDVVSGTVRRSR